MPGTHKRMYQFVPLALGFLSVALSQQTFASGFALPESSILGLATSNALVANPDELGAFSYNPAAMAFHEGSSVSAGAIAIVPNLEVNTASGSHDSQGKDVVGIPTFQGALRISDNFVMGLGVSAPFGLETKWENGTFPAFAGPIAGLAPTHSKLDLIAITPTLAYKFNEHLSVSGGIDYYNAMDVKLNSDAAEIDGDNDEVGWNVALLLRQNDWSFGISYHSDVSIDVKGHFKSDQTGKLPAQANLDLPWRLQAGVRWKASGKLAVEFDVTRTGWSEFEQIKVETDGNAGFLPSGTTLATNTNDWNDATAFRLGATYQITPATQLRFGYTYDKTPQDDDHFSARIPDNDRHLFSIGAGHDLGHGWAVDAGYMFVHFENNNYSSDTPFNPAVDRDPNGTDAYDGKYKSHVHLFGLGISKQFM